jgi:TetR/AcrR family transcriptional repressor of mexJK operon
VASLRPRVEEVLESIGTPPGSGSDLRTALVEFAIRLLTATTSAEAVLMHRLVIAESARFPELGVAFYNAGPERSIAALTMFFAHATATGLMHIADPASTAEMLLGALLGVPIRSVLIRHARPSRPAIAARANAVVSLFIAAYARDVPASGDER